MSLLDTLISKHLGTLASASFSSQRSPETPAGEPAVPPDLEAGSLSSRLLRAGRMDSFAALADGATHELNNLLATLLMSIDLLGRACRGAAEQRVLAPLEELTRRGLQVSRQLQWLARGVECEATFFQPRYLIADLQDLFSATLPRSLSLIADYPSELWPLAGDPLTVYQLLLALVLEARQALAGSGTIRLTASNQRLDARRAGKIGAGSSGHCMVIEVVGSAVRSQPGSDAEREGSRGADLAPTAVSPGLGLGQGLPPGSGQAAGPGTGAAVDLALIAAGGFAERIAAATDYGRRVFLPAVAPDGSSARAGAPVEPRRGSGELILVADEARVLEEMLAATLQRHGYRAVTSQEMALAGALPHGLALVLASAEALGAGASPAQAVLAPWTDQLAGLPVVLMNGAETVPGPCLGRAVRRTLRKPFTSAQLLAAIAGGLGPARLALKADGPAPGPLDLRRGT